MLSEELMNSNSQRNRAPSVKRSQWPGQKYWIILFTTVVLLIAFTASFFVLLFLDGADDGYEDFNDDKGISSSTDKKPNVNTNKEPIYPTNPTRSDYVADSSSYSQQIGGLIQSNNAVLVELGSYQAIAEKDADAKIYPASMTKVMTLLVACENVTSLTKKLAVTQEAIDYKRAQGGSGLLVDSSLGDAFTIEDLLYILSYDSDTIACLLLAKEVAGSEAAFVDMMNAKARSLGLTSTHFTNSTGLHNEEHYSTCREMAAIMAYALDNTLARRILLSTETKSFVAYKGNTDEKVVTYYASPDWYQTDGGTRFKGNVKLETVTVKGGKTGYTDEAGVCLVSYAESNSTGKCYINVIVGKPKGSGVLESVSTADVKCIYNTYAE